MDSRQNLLRKIHENYKKPDDSEKKYPKNKFSKLKNEFENTKKNKILKFLGDGYCRAIIQSITKYPKSAAQISTDCNIRLYMVYRKLRILDDANFLDVSIKIRKDGKKLFLYQSRFSEILASMDENFVDVKVQPNPLVKEHFAC